MSNFVFPEEGNENFYQASYSDNAYSDATQYNSAYYMPQMQQGNSTSSFEDEPPLLEELGINLNHIAAKTKAVLNPFSRFDEHFADDPDMSGPLLFVLLLGFSLLLTGKIQFGQIYGQGIIGCVSIYIIFNLMSHKGIDLYRSTSVVGYGLLPIVILSLIILPFRKIRLVGIGFGAFAILWSTSTAAKIFIAVLDLKNMFWLVAYPLALFYTSFALITIF